MSYFKIAEHGSRFEADLIVAESRHAAGNVLIEVQATDLVNGNHSGAGIRLNPHQALVIGQELIRLAEELKNER